MLLPRWGANCKIFPGGLRKTGTVDSTSFKLVPSFPLLSYSSFLYTSRQAIGNSERSSGLFHNRIQSWVRAWSYSYLESGATSWDQSGRVGGSTLKLMVTIFAARWVIRYLSVSSTLSSRLDIDFIGLGLTLVRNSRLCSGFEGYRSGSILRAAIVSLERCIM